MADPVLTPVEYGLGVLWLVVGVGSLVLGASALRRAFLPGWPPLAAAIAVTIVSLTTALLVAEALGTLGVLRWGVTLVGLATAGAAEMVVARRWGPRAAPPAALETTPSPRPLVWVATAAVAGVLAQWATHTADALGRGMVHADTLWYHGPYSAFFLQTASLRDVGLLGQTQTRFYPLSSELLHTLVAMPFGRDVLSPVLNLLFAGLALAAGALLGARWGVGALTLLSTVVVIGLPTFGATQPGQGSSDVMAAALLLSAVALLVAGGVDRAPLLVAGAALGLAAATKLSVLSLGGVLALGVVVACVRAGRTRNALPWLVGIVVPGAFWAARNWVLADNPLPFFDLRLGPVHLPATARAEGAFSVVRSLTERDGWHTAFGAGLGRGFGHLWPLVLLLAVVGIGLGLWRGTPVLRATAAAMAVGAVAYVLTPYSGGALFQYNLRMLVPTLTVAVPLVALGLRDRPRWHLPLAGILGLLVVVDLTSSHHERVDAWPGYPLVGAATAFAVVIGMVARPAERLARRTPRTVGLAALAAVALVGGFAVQAHYLEHRYVTTGLADDAVTSELRSVSGRRVDVVGTQEVYPMMGADLSNEVHDHSLELLPDRPAPADPCVYWRTQLREADAIAVSSFGFLMRRFSPAERALIFESDPSVTVVYSDPERALYRVDGQLDPDACPAPTL